MELKGLKGLFMTGGASPSLPLSSSMHSLPPLPPDYSKGFSMALLLSLNFMTQLPQVTRTLARVTGYGVAERAPRGLSFVKHICAMFCRR